MSNVNTKSMPPMAALRAFSMAAKHLNFTAAARELTQTQGAVSHSIRELESRLGVLLFERRARGMALTAAGETYLPYVNEALEKLQLGEQSLKPTIESHVLTVSCSPNFAQKWLVPRLGSFYDACPDIDLSVATSVDDRILTSGKSHLREVAHLWQVSQDGLEAEKVAEGTSETQFWVFDDNLQPVLRFDSFDPATRQVMRKTDEGWQPLLTVDLDDTFFPESNVKPDSTLLMRSARGRDKAALVSFNLDTLLETVILENPLADIGQTASLTPTPSLDYIRLGVDSLERHAITENGETFLNILAGFEQPVSVGSHSYTASGRYVTAAISPAGKSFIHLLIDLQNKTHQVLSESHFRRYKDSLVPERAITFPARDGLAIPATLVMPENPAGPIPFIVRIHGGPAGHAELGYERDLQFLVNRGYGVIDVNFRGSTGFGKKFQQAGFREFGRKMQDDISDAAHWLVEQKLADPNALIAMGASYGGYAAALAMTRDPGLFDAAIVEVPMLDPEFQSKFHPGFWEQGLAGWSRYFGKPENPEDLELMQQYSPTKVSANKKALWIRPDSPCEARSY